MRSEEAEAVSALIVRVLHETNAGDYPAEEIERIARGFTPEVVRARMTDRQIYVAEMGERIVGTASLGPERIHSVFVLPEDQGTGIGAALVTYLEDLARAEGRVSIGLSASFTARGFYERLGYKSDPTASPSVDSLPMAKALQVRRPS